MASPKLIECSEAPQAKLARPVFFRQPSRDSCGAPARGEELCGHAAVDFDRFQKLLLGNALFGSVCDVNAAWADEERFAPSFTEGGNVSGERHNCRWNAVVRREANRRYVQDFEIFDAASGSSGYSLACARWIADRAKHDFGLGEVRDDVGRATAVDCADVQRAAAEQFVLREFDFANVLKDIEQRVNGGVAEFGIRGVRKFPFGGQLETQSAFGTEREKIFCGFAIDEKLRPARRL